MLETDSLTLMFNPASGLRALKCFFLFISVAIILQPMVEALFLLAVELLQGEY